MTAQGPTAMESRSFACRTRGGNAAKARSPPSMPGALLLKPVSLELDRCARRWYTDLKSGRKYASIFNVFWCRGANSILSCSTISLCIRIHERRFRRSVERPAPSWRCTVPAQRSQWVGRSGGWFEAGGAGEAVAAQSAVDTGRASQLT